MNLNENSEKSRKGIGVYISLILLIFICGVAIIEYKRSVYYTQLVANEVERSNQCLEDFFKQSSSNLEILRTKCKFKKPEVPDYIEYFKYELDVDND